MSPTALPTPSALVGVLCLAGWITTGVFLADAVDTRSAWEVGRDVHSPTYRAEESDARYRAWEEAAQTSERLSLLASLLTVAAAASLSQRRERPAGRPASGREAAAATLLDGLLFGLLLFLLLGLRLAAGPSVGAVFAGALPSLAFAPAAYAYGRGDTLGRAFTGVGVHRPRTHRALRAVAASALLPLASILALAGLPFARRWPRIGALHLHTFGLVADRPKPTMPLHPAP
ncbi:MAG: hypothetical protein AAGF12_15895 [Myxococcota bacterium]